VNSYSSKRNPFVVLVQAQGCFVDAKRSRAFNGAFSADIDEDLKIDRARNEARDEMLAAARIPVDASAI